LTNILNMQNCILYFTTISGQPGDLRNESPSRRI